MGEIDETIMEAVEGDGKHEHGSRLNAAVAVMVAITATLMAIGNIKDGNICQGMEQAQANRVDAWSYYQAKSIKQHMAENMSEQLQLRLDTEPQLSAEARAKLAKAVDSYTSQSKQFTAQMVGIEKSAKGYQSEYDELNFHDDQFDMSEALMTISIALYGVSALTKKRWLFGAAFVMTVLGTSLEVAAFIGWTFHPDWLANFLS